MALISCPECTKEISDSVKRCPHCGYSLKRQKKEKRKLFKTKKQRIVFIVIASILISTALGVGGFFGYKYYFEPLGRYNTANALVQEQKFDDAIKEFEKLGNFKDSQNKVLETHYNKAKHLLNSKDYEAVVAELELAQSFKGAEELLKETKYQWAESATLDKAIDLYTELGDYKDSKDKLNATKKSKKEQEALQKLRKAEDACESVRTSISSDGKSITVDSYGEYDFTSLADIMIIISTLDLPDSLYDEMCATNALMGRQTESFENYEVSWSYHPDNGLDAIFKYIE